MEPLIKEKTRREKLVSVVCCESGLCSRTVHSSNRVGFLPSWSLPLLGEVREHREGAFWPGILWCSCVLPPMRMRWGQGWGPV